MEVKKTYKKRGVNLYRLEAINKFAGNKILDVGCGNGAYIYQLHGKKDIYGCDYQSFEEWENLKERFRVCDATEIDFDTESFDTLTAFEVMEHVSDPQEMLKEMHRVARKNIILTVPNCVITEGMKQSNLLYSHWGDPTHVNFYTLESFKEEVEKAGFKIEEAYLINKINPFPFINEAMGGGSKIVPKILRKIYGKSLKSEYFITCLIVAKK